MRFSSNNALSVQSKDELMLSKLRSKEARIKIPQRSVHWLISFAYIFVLKVIKFHYISGNLLFSTCRLSQISIDQCKCGI